MVELIVGKKGKGKTKVLLDKVNGAVKEANGDIEAAKKTKDLCGDELDIYSGNDTDIYDILNLGGIGVISVISNILPKETNDMCLKYLEGNTKDASDALILTIS